MIINHNLSTLFLEFNNISEDEDALAEENEEPPSRSEIFELYIKPQMEEAKQEKEQNQRASKAAEERSGSLDLDLGLGGGGDSDHIIPLEAALDVYGGGHENSGKFSSVSQEELEELGLDTMVLIPTLFGRQFPRYISHEMVGNEQFSRLILTFKIMRESLFDTKKPGKNPGCCNLLLPCFTKESFVHVPFQGSLTLS